METRFDAAAAKELIKQMMAFCSVMQNNGIELNNLISDNSSWKDSQFDAFRNNIEAIIDGLEKILSYESEYINTFGERVRELRG